MAKTMKCPTCGKEFKPFRNAQKYCSVICREKYYSRKKATMQTYECSWCGLSFETEHKRKYCCEDCRMRANYRKSRKKKNAVELAGIENLARKEGLTYGKYVAKYGL